MFLKSLCQDIDFSKCIKDPLYRKLNLHRYHLSKRSISNLQPLISFLSISLK